MGPRTRPGNILKETTEISPDSVFNPNLETKNIEVSVAGNTYEIGDRLIYIDKSLEK
jgi:hypothetical protein